MPQERPSGRLWRPRWVPMCCSGAQAQFQPGRGLGAAAQVEVRAGRARWLAARSRLLRLVARQLEKKPGPCWLWLRGRLGKVPVGRR